MHNFTSDIMKSGKISGPDEHAFDFEGKAAQSVAQL